MKPVRREENEACKSRETKQQEKRNKDVPWTEIIEG